MKTVNTDAEKLPCRTKKTNVSHRKIKCGTTIKESERSVFKEKSIEREKNEINQISSV